MSGDLNVDLISDFSVLTKSKLDTRGLKFVLTSIEQSTSGPLHVNDRKNTLNLKAYGASIAGFIF